MSVYDMFCFEEEIKKLELNIKFTRWFCEWQAALMHLIQ